jgi:hypothetical protein
MSAFHLQASGLRLCKSLTFRRPALLTVALTVALAHMGDAAAHAFVTRVSMFKANRNITAAWLYLRPTWDRPPARAVAVNVADADNS